MTNCLVKKTVVLGWIKEERWVKKMEVEVTVKKTGREKDLGHEVMTLIEHTLLQKFFVNVKEVVVMPNSTEVVYELKEGEEYGRTEREGTNQGQWKTRKT
jgi:hypothetical protein